jgi:hypothetical protein
MAREQISTLTVVGKSENMEQIIGQLNRLGIQAKLAGDSVVQAGKRLGDLDRDLAKQERQLVGAPRAFATYERGVKLLQRGMNAGRIDAQAFAQQMTDLQKRLQTAIAPRLGLDVDQSGLRRLIDGEVELSASTRRATMELLRQQQELNQLRNQFDPAHAAAARMSQEIKALADMKRAGIPITGGYAAALKEVRLRYDEVARAAQEASQQQERMIATARAENAAAVSQARYSSLAGVVEPRSGTARESAGAFDGLIEAERAAEAMAARAALLRQELDPLAAAQDRLNAELAEYNAMAAAGHLSTHELTQATARANLGFQMQAARLGVANDNLELNNQQLMNMQYQINDIGVMLASGQNPFVMLMQQGMQISQMFAPGTGVMAALRGVGTGIASFLTNPINLAVIGIAAAAGSISKFASVFNAEVKPLEDVLSAHDELVRRIAENYEGLTGRIERFSQRTREMMIVELGIDRSQLDKAMQEQIDLIQRGFTGDSLWYGGMDYTDPTVVRTIEAYDSIAREVDALRDAMREGSADFTGFRQELAAAYAQAGDDDEMRKAIETAYLLVDAAVSVEAAIKGAGESLRSLDPAARRAAGAWQSFQGSLAAMQEFLPDRRTARQQIEDAFAQATMGPTLLSQEQIAELNQKRLEGLTEIARQEQAIRDGHALDLRAITARSAAERAEIEAQRMRLSLAGEAIEAAEIERRVAEARQLSLAQSQQEINEMLRARSLAEQDAIDALRMEMRAIGETAGEVARLGVEYDMLREYKEAAYQAGRGLSEDEIRHIQQHAAAVGELTQAYAEAALQQDILFERSLIGLPDEERSIRQRLRSAGIDAESANGRILASQIRVNDEMKRSTDMAKDFVSTLVDGLSDGESALDGLMKAFSQFGRQFAQMGVDRLFAGGLFAGVPGNASSPLPAGQISLVGREIGQAIAPVITSGISDSMAGFAAAIRKVESGSYEGNYGALGPIMTRGSYQGDRAYGAYQVMGRNIAQWTKEATGTAHSIQQFLADKSVQDRVFQHKFGQSVEKFGSFADGASVWFSGRPLSQAGNRSDGFNTVSQYVGKAESALAGFEPTTFRNTMTRATSDGIIDAGMRAANDNWAGLRTVTPGGQGGFFANGGMGVLGAAGGAFAGGFQSGNPLMGGVSGAMTGFGAAPQISSALGISGALGAGLGIIGGGILGAIGALFGRSRQRRQEQRKAQQELESQMGQITSFLDEITGVFAGPYLQRFREVNDELQKIRDMASKAGNTALRREADAAAETFFRTLVDDWNRSVDGFVASFEAGTGFSGAFVEANEAVKEMEKSLLGFVEDAKFFADANGDMSTALANARGGAFMTPERVVPFEYNPQAGIDGAYIDFVNRHADLLREIQLAPYTRMQRAGGGDIMGGMGAYQSVEGLQAAMRDLGIVFDEFGDVVAETAEAARQAVSVEQAQYAASLTALAQLSGARTFSDIETQIQTLQGKASALPGLLEKLGRSAEDAAAAVEQHLAIAMEQLRRGYEADVQRSINSLSGLDYLNELIEAQARYNDRLTDAAALGLDAALPLRELNLQLAQIAHGADLTKDQIAELATAFPQIADAIRGALDLVSISEAQRQVDDARQALQRARDEELRTLNETVTAYQRFIDQTRDFLDSMRLSNVSPLNQRDRVAEAERQFRDVYGRALTGDKDAMDDLRGVSQSWLDEARSYYQSSEAYQAIFLEVEALLSGSLGSAKSQLSATERQLKEVERQTDILLGIDDSVLSLADATRQLADATARLSAAEREAIKGSAPIATQTDMTSRLIDKLYRDVLGRAPEQAGMDYWRSIVGANGLTQDVYAMFAAAARAQGERVIMPGYSSGGYTGDMARGAVAGVVHGQEFVVNARATERWRPQLEAINRGGAPDSGNQAALIAEIRGLRQEVAGLKAAQRHQTDIIGRVGETTVKTIERGNRINEDTGAAMKLRNAS